MPVLAMRSALPNFLEAKAQQERRHFARPQDR
jgi:hypothetical protein